MTKEQLNRIRRESMLQYLCEYCEYPTPTPPRTLYQALQHHLWGIGMEVTRAHSAAKAALAGKLNDSDRQRIIAAHGGRPQTRNLKWTRGTP